MSAAWLGRILGLDSGEIIDFALARWRKFLYRTDAAGKVHWRLYHSSFGDFLTEKLEGAKQYHSQIIDYYLSGCGGDWAKLTALDDAYGLRHLASHMAGAERWKELHSLVAEGQDGHQSWAEAHREADGSYARYLADLATAWAYADEEAVHDAAAMSRQVRYALIKSSIHALAENIPPELLMALVQYGVPGWTPTSALRVRKSITSRISSG